MTASTLSTLRPLSLAELLDQAVRLYRKNFLTFVGIIGIVQVPIQVISVLISLVTFGGVFGSLGRNGAISRNPSAIFTPAYFVGIGLSILTSFIYVLLVYGFATAAITRAIADSYLGQSIGIFKSYGRIVNSSLKLIAALMLAYILGAVLFIWLIIPCVGWISGPGMLAFFFGIIVPLIAPAIVLENQGVGGAFRRAWDLARRRFWWVIGFVAILFIFGQIVISGPTTLMTFLLQGVLGNPVFAANPQAVFTLQTIITSVVGLAFSLIYVPFQLTNITLVYFDLRIRTEGLDLALQADSSTSQTLNVEQLLAHAPRPDQGALVTMKEVGYFILLSIGAGTSIVVIYIAFTAIVLAVVGASGGFRPSP